MSEARSEAKARALEIERLKLQLAKACHERFGQSSELASLLVEQLELAIEDLEETQAEEETKAEIVRRIDELFAIERGVNDQRPEARRAARQDHSKPLVAALEAYMREQYEGLSPKNEVVKAIRCMLVRWTAFTRFLDDGRICMSNNAAERVLRGVALGHRNWTFPGSDEGGRRAAAVYSLITTAQ